MKVKLFCSLTIIISLLITSEVSAYTLKITKVVCNSSDTTFAKVEICRLKAVSRTVQYVNIYLKFLKLPITDLIGRFRFLKKSYDYKPFLYDFTIKCDFIKKLNPLTNLVWNWFKDSSNLNHSCPLVEDFEIKRLENLYIQRKLQALPVPAGDYCFSTNFTLNGKYNFHALFYATISS